MAITNLGRVSLVPQGLYSAATQYEYLDLVYYNGTSYCSLATQTGVTPINDGVAWQQIYQPLYAEDLAYAVGSPAGTYANLTALNAANPDHSKIYVTDDDGHWNYYSTGSSAFVSGGVYQAVSIADGAVTPEKTSFVLDDNSVNLFDRTTVDAQTMIAADGNVYTGAPYIAYSLSDFIPVTPGDILAGTYDAVLSTDQFGAWFDADETLTTIITGSIDGGHFTTTVPAGAAFVKINIKTTRILEWMLAKTTYPAAYVPYYTGYVLDDNISLKDSPEVARMLYGQTVSALLEGTSLRIRASFNNTYDIVLDCLTESASNLNEHFNMVQYELIDKTRDLIDPTPGTLYKNADDDICPFVINGSYRGGNHGIEYEYMVTHNTHGKTEVDIGSVWTDAGANDYILVRIYDANNVSFISEYTGTPAAPLRKVAPDTTLAHKSGATHTDAVNCTTTTQIQTNRTINNKSLTIINDVGQTLATDGILYGKWIDVRESYGVPSVPALITFLKANVGSNTNDSTADDSIATDATVSNVYRFIDKLACTMYTSIDFNATAVIGYIGITHAGEMGSKYLVPNTTYDSVFTKGPAEIIDFLPASYRTASVPPYRYINFSNDMSGGFAIGYIYYLSNLTSAERDAATTSGGYITAGGKMYPYWVNGVTYAADEHISVTAFRAPFVPYAEHASAVAYTIFEYGGKYILTMDFDAAFNDYVQVPAYLIGKPIEVIDQHTDTTIDQLFVEYSGIKVNNSGTTGFLVLKIG